MVHIVGERNTVPDHFWAESVKSGVQNNVLMQNTSMVSFDGGSPSKVDDVTA